MEIEGIMNYMKSRYKYNITASLISNVAPLCPARKGKGESLLGLLIFLLLLSSCVIKDDIPFPIREAVVTAFEVDGQCDAGDNVYEEANIDKTTRTVDVYVSDTVDLSALTIKRFEVSNEATIIPEEGICLHPNQFPTTSFWRTMGDTSSKVNFSNGNVHFTLRTFQDYEWTIRVRQLILREVHIEGQIGEAVIDPVNQNVIVYVAASKDLSKLKVHRFSLGGTHGTVSPDPTLESEYDFSEMRTFQVTLAGSREKQTWQVFVYKTDAVEAISASAFPRSVSATISGTVPMGTQPFVEYHASSTSEWTTVNMSQVSVAGTRFTADITGLRPGTTYTYRVTSGTAESNEQTFTTVAEQYLLNGGFDEWSSIIASSGKELLQPWAEGDIHYWSTGNAGATTVGNSNSTYVDEDGRRYANLQSKYIVIKFAAGNIFTGEYIETDGSNGVLSFGRPFTSFPTKMRFDYKYKTSTITRTGGDWKEAWGNYISKSMYENFKGQPDSCSIYIALGDWEPVSYQVQFGARKGETVVCPYLIRTRPSALHLFDMNSPNLIAFAQLTKGEDVNEWTTETLTINYRVRDRQPKYIIVVASSSKYGDYFTGGEESLLQLDNLELLYE